MAKNNHELTHPSSVVEFPLDKPENTYNFTGKGIVTSINRLVGTVEFYDFDKENESRHEFILEEGSKKGTWIKRFPSWRLAECKADYSGSVVYYRFEEKNSKWVSSLELLAMPIERSPKYEESPLCFGD